MWHYKSGDDTVARQRARLQLAALLARFLTTHRACIVEVAGQD
jgi:hypothetical protein